MEKEFKFDVGDVVRLPGNHVGTTAGEVFTVEKRWHGMTGEDTYLLRSTTRNHVTIDANGYYMSKVECEIRSSAANEGETFSDVAKVVDDFKCAGYIHASRVLYIVKDIGKRFAAAHKREIDEKDDEESERLSRIFNIVIDSNEENWSDCMSRIEEITREVI